MNKTFTNSNKIRPQLFQSTGTVVKRNLNPKGSFECILRTRVSRVSGEKTRTNICANHHITPRGKPPLNLVQLLPFELALAICHALLHHLHSIIAEFARVTLAP
jgi:hypothetical protein